MSKAHETRDSLNSSYSQVVLIYLYLFRRNSLLKFTPQPQIAKNTKNSEKFIKNFFFGKRGVQGRSKSSMLINLKSMSPVLIMISSMSVPICNRSHTIRAN